MIDYINRQVPRAPPPKRVTSPIRDLPPPCKQALKGTMSRLSTILSFC